MLTLRHCTKTFFAGTPDAKTALCDLSFHAAPGDFITVIGANGAGKSTLFNAIAGNFRLDRGQILLDGTDLTWMPEYRRARSIGRLFQRWTRRYGKPQNRERCCAHGDDREKHRPAAAGRGDCQPDTRK